MKKISKIVPAIILALAMVLQFKVVPVQAASDVTIHVKNDIGWSEVNIYTWGDDGELAKAWPGTTMTDEGNGWLTYTFKNVTSDLNLVFCVDADKDGKQEAQTSDVKGVKADKSEYWVTIGAGTGEANDLGAAAAGAATITDKKPDNYTASGSEKKADNNDTAADAKSTEKSEQKTTTATDTKKAATEATTAKKANAPKTGDTMPVVVLGVMVLAALSYGVSRKVKEN